MFTRTHAHVLTEHRCSAVANMLAAGALTGPIGLLVVWQELLVVFHLAAVIILVLLPLVRLFVGHGPCIEVNVRSMSARTHASHWLYRYGTTRRKFTN